jgi:hypothetical protein
MHSWWHTLVLLPQLDAVSASSVSLEDRFALLQRAFDQQLELERTASQERYERLEETLVSRIQKLESLWAVR